MSTMLPVSLAKLAGSGSVILLGALAATLLVILIVEREALRAYGEPFARRARKLDIAIYPLLLVFAIVLLERFYHIIFL
jgi:hypothetical protein